MQGCRHLSMGQLRQEGCRQRLRCADFIEVFGQGCKIVVVDASTCPNPIGQKQAQHTGTEGVGRKTPKVRGHVAPITYRQDAQRRTNARATSQKKESKKNAVHGLRFAVCPKQCEIGKSKAKGGEGGLDRIVQPCHGAHCYKVERRGERCADADEGIRVDQLNDGIGGESAANPRHQ